jgi:hypothetical protein
MEKKEIKKQEPKYTSSQACILLKLGYYDQKVVAKKYGGRVITLSNWKVLLKRDNLNF